VNYWYKAVWKPNKGHVLSAVEKMWPGDDWMGKFKIDLADVLEVFTLNLESGGHCKCMHMLLSPISPLQRASWPLRSLPYR